MALSVDWSAVPRGRRATRGEEVNRITASKARTESASDADSASAQASGIPLQVLGPGNQALGVDWLPDPSETMTAAARHESTKHSAMARRLLVFSRRTVPRISAR